MKKYLCAALCLVAIEANASDSSWLLCKSDQYKHDEFAPVINLYEHRSGTGDDRVMDILLIYGGQVMTGSLKNAYDGKINLKTSSAKGDSFKGSISVNFADSRLTLKGVYHSEVDAMETPYTLKLPCEDRNR